MISVQVALAAEVERLRAELADLQDGYSRLSRDFALAIESDSKHIAELAECKEDAERYRWLRNRIPGSAYRIAGIIYSEGGAGVDAGIDAARKGEGEE